MNEGDGRTDRITDDERTADEVCRRFEAAWRAGATPSLLDACRSVPANQLPSAFVRLWRMECEHRGRLDQRPDSASVISEFPQLASLLTSGSEQNASPTSDITLASERTLPVDGPPRGASLSGNSRPNG